MDRFFAVGHCSSMSDTALSVLMQFASKKPAKSRARSFFDNISRLLSRHRERHRFILLFTLFSFSLLRLSSPFRGPSVVPAAACESAHPTLASLSEMYPCCSVDPLLVGEHVSDFIPCRLVRTIRLLLSFVNGSCHETQDETRER